MHQPDMLKGATRMVRIQKWIWKFKCHRRQLEFDNITEDPMDRWLMDRCRQRKKIHMESLDPVFKLDGALEPDWLDRYELFSEPPRGPARFSSKRHRLK